MSLSVLIATIMRPDGDTGVQTHFRTFASWLANSKQNYRIITPFDLSKVIVYPIFAIRRLIDPLNSTASVWWYRYWHALFLRYTLYRILADGNPCAIYAQCPLSANAALRARASSAQRVFMVVHFNVSQADEWAGKGSIPEKGVLFNSIRLFETDVLPRLDGIVYVSDFMRRELVQRIPELKKVPYRVIPNFLVDPGVHPVSNTTKPDLICIGTLEPRKNQRFALEIIAAARRLGYPLSLTLVGDGPNHAELKILAAQLGIENDVWFTGYIKQAATLLSGHKACLHVAQIENFPITLLEAMSCGLPVFAPSVGGIPEMFFDGIQGRFIPLDDAEDAARRILEWISVPYLLARASMEARLHFIRKFEANSAARDLLNFLNCLY